MNQSLEILLVEDNPADAELTMHALGKHRLANHVVHVADGQAALDYFFGEGRAVSAPSTLVLLDLKLPKVGGIEVLRQLRADERTKDVPIVVLTSSREDQDVMETYKLGANSYIVKPVDFENFSAAVNNMGLYWLLLSGAPKQTP
jgi:two-component system response regulator